MLCLLLHVVCNCNMSASFQTEQQCLQVNVTTCTSRLHWCCCCWLSPLIGTWYTSVRTQQCTHTITGLQGVAVEMLLWLLIGSHAECEDLRGYTSHSHVLGSSTLSWSGTLVNAVTVNDYAKSPYIVFHSAYSIILVGLTGKAIIGHRTHIRLQSPDRRAI